MNLFFQIEYDFTAGLLQVEIIQCRDLVAMDMGGTSDPYVKIYLLPGRGRFTINFFRVESFKALRTFKVKHDLSSFFRLFSASRPSSRNLDFFCFSL